MAITKKTTSDLVKKVSEVKEVIKKKEIIAVDDLIGKSVENKTIPVVEKAVMVKTVPVETKIIPKVIVPVTNVARVSTNPVRTMGQQQVVVSNNPMRTAMPMVSRQTNLIQDNRRRMNTRNMAIRPVSNYGNRVNTRIIQDVEMPTEVVEGFLDMEVNGHGLLKEKYNLSDRDIYISTSQIKRFRIKPGDSVRGPARKPKEGERYWGLLQVTHLNGIEVAKIGERPKFDRLTPVYPNKQLILETKKEDLVARIIDLIAPIGRGQRGMIVSPPKAGKTTIMKEIANGITDNHKDVMLMAVLVGERPEEVTDFARSIHGEVAASNFDEPPDVQVRVAELALERARRLVEMGNHVVILLDSITRLARAYNLAIPTSGRTLSGGFDPAALYPPKRFFGAARNFEDFQTMGEMKTGSLTIIGTALVDTGSKMDDLIYEEFKGTGNMELHLSRALAERRIYPAIDIQKSGTRMDHLMFSKAKYEKVKTLIRMIDMLGANERTELILQRLKDTKSNKEFLDSMGQ